MEMKVPATCINLSVATALWEKGTPPPQPHSTFLLQCVSGLTVCVTSSQAFQICNYDYWWNVLLKKKSMHNTDIIWHTLTLKKSIYKGQLNLFIFQIELTLQSVKMVENSLVHEKNRILLFFWLFGSFKQRCVIPPPFTPCWPSCAAEQRAWQYCLLPVLYCLFQLGPYYDFPTKTAFLEDYLNTTKNNGKISLFEFI